MRTKNAKRLWPVPATLTVVALAAFLAFGLMATTGAQPAAAQDANCTVPITTGGSGDLVQIDDDVTCSAMGDEATIKFTGPGGNPSEAEDIEVYVLVQDNKGDLSFYANSDVWQAEDATVTVNVATVERERGTFYTDRSAATEAKPTKYAEHNITVPRAKREGGRWVAQSITITVQGKGTVHVFLPDENDADIVADFEDADCEPACADLDDVDPPKALKFESGQPAADSATVSITFLGPPAIGKDSDNDRNKILEDFMQCMTSAADGEFAITTTDSDGLRGNCGQQGSSDVLDTDDKAESRSKLIAVTGTDVTTLINGKSMDHELDDDDSATVYVVLKDADGDALEDTDVDFSVTSEPSSVFTSARTVGTKAADATTYDTVAGIEEGNAIASRVIDNLPTDHGYRVTVEISSGGVDLGTIVITRHGTPETLKAATFNAACLEDVGKESDEDPDYGPAMVDLENKDCAETTRFGAGDVIVVKSHLEDSLGTVTAGDIEVDLADDFDDPLDTDGEDQLDRAVAANANPVAFVYVVDEDAMLGDHMITVSTDEDDVDDVTLTVQVAGPPDSYSIAGDSHIALNGSTTFTVTAVDEEMGIPAFTMDDTSTANEDESNDKVQVFIQGLLAGNIRGLDSNNMLKLDVETGMGSFTVYAPPAASQGHVIRIFVATGDMEVMHSAMFGMAPTAIMPPMELGQAMDLTATANADGSITLMFTPGTSATHHFVYGNVSAVSAVWEFADGMNMHTVSADQLVSGTEYSFYVISGRFMKADDGTWPGEWSSAGWTNVAKAMAQ